MCPSVSLAAPTFSLVKKNALSKDKTTTTTTNFVECVWL